MSELNAIPSDVERLSATQLVALIVQCELLKRRLNAQRAAVLAEIDKRGLDVDDLRALSTQRAASTMHSVRRTERKRRSLHQ